MANIKTATAVQSQKGEKRRELESSLNLPYGVITDAFVQQYQQSQTIVLGGGGLTPSAPPPIPPILPPPAYKVGDRVVMSMEGLLKWGDQANGKEGVIVTIPAQSIPAFDVSVRWDGNAPTLLHHYDASQVELVAKKIKIPLPVKKKIPFESVVISDEKREEIQAAISQFDNADLLFDTWGFSEVFEKGTAVTLLFWGTPGTGKTLAAQAIAEELGAELKIYGMAEIGSSEPGGSERFIQKIFKTAKDFFTINKKQQVILFDECDALLYDRNKVGVILGAQINTLLTEIEHHDGIVIFTTNRLGVLDPALERRVAAKIEFPFPDRESREKIWKRMIPTKAPIAKDVNFKELSIYPLPGGNIKNAVLNAARMATYKKQKHITMHNFVQAVEKEAQSQAEFEANYDRGNESRGWSAGHTSDYAIGPDRKLGIDSVFNQKRRQS